LEEGSSDGPDRNWVYGLSNTTIEDLWITHNVSTIGWSQLILSTQTPEFEVILDQLVQASMTHLAADYERLNGKMFELHPLVMKMRSHMGGTCAPFCSP